MLYRLGYVKCKGRDACVVEYETVCEVKESEGIETQLRMKLQGKAYSVLGSRCRGIVQALEASNQLPPRRITMVTSQYSLLSLKGVGQ